MRNICKAAMFIFYLGSLAGCDSQAPPQLSPATIHYDTVKEERLVLTSALPGRISAVVMAEVRPQVDGIILERLFEEGSYVTKGQVLYQIDPAIYEANYNTAKANLAEAEANLNAQAMREKRYRKLVKVNAISQQDLDNAVAAHGQARARIAKAKAQLESTTINLAYTEIKAPVSGRIGASAVTMGALVTANQPDPLATIRQTDRVYVDITQSSAETIRLRRALAQGTIALGSGSARVSLTLEDGSPYTRLGLVPKTPAQKEASENTTHGNIAQNGDAVNTPAIHSQHNSPDVRIFGHLLFSEISVGESTGSVALRAIIDNPDGFLLPGMYVTATIEEGTLDKAMLIPQKSVLSDNSGQHFVYIVHDDSQTVPAQIPSLGSTAFAHNGENNHGEINENGKVSSPVFQTEQRAIILDRPVGNRWLARSGLMPGEQVVVEGLQKVTPGEQVRGISLKNAGKYEHVGLCENTGPYVHTGLDEGSGNPATAPVGTKTLSGGK